MRYNEVMVEESSKTILEWSYLPKSFFETTCKLNIADGSVVIDDGLVRGEFKGSNYDLGSDFRDAVHDTLALVFQAQQVQSHQEFTLSSPAMLREYPEGRRDITVFAELFRLELSMGRGDFLLKDASGDVTQDTKAERLAKQDALRSDILYLSPTDLPIKRMLQSFQNALADKDNLFIHLYEVRESLISEFGGHGPAKSAVGVSSSDWAKFGRLSNNEPVLEGRHRGNHDNLRSATDEEKKWALCFAQDLIQSYVTFCVKSQNP